MSRPRLRLILGFLRRLAAKAWRDEVVLRSSALAFSTITSLVPLLALVSIFVARTLREDTSRFVRLLTDLLPYSEEAVVGALEGFLSQAESVGSVALLGFVIISLLTFFGVQDSLFHIFGVASPPRLLRRVATFSLLFFWGPLLVGSAQAGLLVFGQSSQAAARLLEESALLRALPALVTFVGLTMLFWRAAAGHVGLRHAAAGGLAAAVALELLKGAFAYYAREFTEVQIAVYGTFAIALLFVLSIQIAWTILLCGAEIAACLAGVGAAVDEPRRHGPDPWLGMAALELLGSGRPRLATPVLARELGVPADEVERSLGPLLASGLLERDAAGERAYRLALPSRQTRLAAVLAVYRRGRESAGSPGMPRRALELRSRLGRATEFELGEQTLADLLDDEGTRPVTPHGAREAGDLAGRGGGG